MSKQDKKIFLFSINKEEKKKLIAAPVVPPAAQQLWHKYKNSHMTC